MCTAAWQHDGEQTIYIGIDSGSTTTKIVALTPERELLYTYYRVNRGNPIATVVEGLRRQMRRADKLCAPFRYYQPFHDIFDIAREASHVINLNAQFGEGWLLPAEVISAVRSGATHVVSLQPFGCIANHIVCRGIENKLKRYLPELNLLSLDFDSNVSEVNVVNRLLLFVEDLE